MRHDACPLEWRETKSEDNTNSTDTQYGGGSINEQAQ